jgi:hypothetical protein
MDEVRGNLAYFDLTIQLLQMLFKFPDGTRIERMHVSNTTPEAISIVISHPELREVHWGEWIPRIHLTVSLDEGRLLVHRWEESDDQAS